MKQGPRFNGINLDCSIDQEQEIRKITKKNTQAITSLSQKQTRVEQTFSNNNNNNNSFNKNKNKNSIFNTRVHK